MERIIKIIKKYNDFIYKNIVMLLLTAILTGSFGTNIIYAYEFEVRDYYEPVVLEDRTSKDIVVKQMRAGHQKASSLTNTYEGYTYLVDFTHVDGIQFGYKNFAQKCCSSPRYSYPCKARFTIPDIGLSDEETYIYYLPDMSYISGAIRYSDYYDLSRYNLSGRKGVDVASYTRYDKCLNCGTDIRKESFGGYFVLYDYRGICTYVNSPTVEIGASTKITPKCNEYTKSMVYKIRYQGEQYFSVLTPGTQKNGMNATINSDFSLSLGNVTNKNGNFEILPVALDRTGQMSYGFDEALGTGEKIAKVTVVDGTGPAIKRNQNVYDRENGKVTVVFTATDNVGLPTNCYSFDGAAYSAVNSKTYSKEGTYSIKVIDTSGNVSEQKFIITADDVKVSDKTPPVINMNDRIYDKDNGKVTISVTATDNEGMPYDRYSFDGAVYSAANYKTYSKAGTYSIKVKDLAGNVAESSFTITDEELKIPDKKPPVVRIKEKIQDRQSGRVTVIFTASDDIGLSDNCFSFDDGETYCDENYRTFDEAGIYSVKVKDLSGNIATLNFEVTEEDVKKVQEEKESGEREDSGDSGDKDGSSEKENSGDKGGNGDRTEKGENLNNETQKNSEDDIKKDTNSENKNDLNSGDTSKKENDTNVNDELKGEETEKEIEPQPELPEKHTQQIKEEQKADNSNQEDNDQEDNKRIDINININRNEEDTDTENNDENKYQDVRPIIIETNEKEDDSKTSNTDTKPIIQNKPTESVKPQSGTQQKPVDPYKNSPLIDTGGIMDKLSEISVGITNLISEFKEEPSESKTVIDSNAGNVIPNGATVAAGGVPNGNTGGNSGTASKAPNSGKYSSTSSDKDNNSKSLDDKINSTKPKDLSLDEKNSLFDSIMSNSSEYITSKEEVDYERKNAGNESSIKEIEPIKLVEDSNNASMDENLMMEAEALKGIKPNEEKARTTYIIFISVILLLLLILAAIFLFFAVILYSEKDIKNPISGEVVRMNVPVALRFLLIRKGTFSLNINELLSEYRTMEAHLGILFVYIFEGEYLRILSKVRGDDKREIAKEEIKRIITIGQGRGKR